MVDLASAVDLEEVTEPLARGSDGTGRARPTSKPTMNAAVGVLAVALGAIATSCADAGPQADRDACGAESCASMTTRDPTTVPPTSPPFGSNSPEPPLTVSIQGLVFTLPSELRFRTDGFTSTGESIDGFYANVPLGSACAHGCGLSALSPLPDGAVVVGIGVLSGAGVGEGNPEHLAPNISVAGRSAVFLTDVPGTCGGEETIQVWIPNPSGNDQIVRACLYGTDLTASEQTVRSVLASAELVGQ